MHQPTCTFTGRKIRFKQPLCTIKKYISDLLREPIRYQAASIQTLVPTFIIQTRDIHYVTDSQGCEFFSCYGFIALVSKRSMIDNRMKFENKVNNLTISPSTPKRSRSRYSHVSSKLDHHFHFKRCQTF